MTRTFPFATCAVYDSYLCLFFIRERLCSGKVKFQSTSRYNTNSFYPDTQLNQIFSHSSSQHHILLLHTPLTTHSNHLNLSHDILKVRRSLRPTVSSRNKTSSTHRRYPRTRRAGPNVFGLQYQQSVKRDQRTSISRSLSVAEED